jgi:heme ABC exporter ATP-binding subunit CcmA
LSVRFGSRVALRDVAIRVQHGDVLALFGPNGAGKTTLLRVLSTLLRPTRGTALLEGLDLSSRRLRVTARRRIGLLSHQTMLYDRLTAMENLLFYARMYGVASPRERCRRLLEEVGLSGREDDLAGEYSRGMQQRLAIARALVHDPELLLLDEPFSGLDPQASAFLHRLLSGLKARGKTIVFTSHDLEAGLALCRRAAILARGSLVFDSPREAIEPRSFPEIYDLSAAPPARGG